MTKQILVMNNFPLVEMLAFFPRYSEVHTFDWRRRYVRQVRHIRSCHTKTLGGVQYSFFSIVTQQGEAMDVRFNHDELFWDVVALPGSELAIHSEDGSHFVIDRILVHQQRHKHQPSLAHRMRPIRFEWLPHAQCARQSPIEYAKVDRMHPYRFLKGKNSSYQVHRIETRHLEDVIVTRHFHYVVEDTERRFYHVVYILDQGDWRFIQEVDEQFLFHRSSP